MQFAYSLLGILSMRTTEGRHAPGAQEQVALSPQQPPPPPPDPPFPLEHSNHLPQEAAPPSNSQPFGPLWTKAPGSENVYSLVEYLHNCQIQLTQEFSAANFPHGRHAHRFWGEEDNSAQLPTDPLRGWPSDLFARAGDVPPFPRTRTYGRGAAALSHDGKLVAVASDDKVEVYDAGTLEKRGEFGVGFRVESMEFLNTTGVMVGMRARYALVTSSHRTPKVAVWPLVADGKLDTSLDTVEFPGGLSSISHDSKWLVVSQYNDSPNGWYKSEETNTWKRTTGIPLPQLVIVDALSCREKFRLKGHDDSIVWTKWSPDDKVIVTASFDNTYRLWDTTTGNLRAVIGPSIGVSKEGAFLPNGKHILLYIEEEKSRKYIVYDTHTGEPVQHLPWPLKDSRPDDPSNTKYRVGLTMHPSENVALLNVARSLYLWDLDKPEEDAEEIWALAENERDPPWNLFGGVTPYWVDAGKKLVAYGAENTVYVWDREKNSKWRFQRPWNATANVTGRKPHVFFRRDEEKSEEFVVAVNGDDMLRVWKL